jgi:hypothetical protein
MKKVREQMSEAAAATPKDKVAEPPAFLGNEDRVTVSQLNPAVGGFSVGFAFDRQLAGMMDRVANATFNKETKTYEVPQSSEPTLGNVVSAMRKVARSISDDLAAIQNLATESGRKAQVANGSSHHVTPQVSMFHEQERFYTGHIVNANAHFVAQLSGFGKQDGALKERHSIPRTRSGKSPRQSKNSRCARRRIYAMNSCWMPKISRSWKVLPKTRSMVPRYAKRLPRMARATLARCWR